MMDRILQRVAARRRGVTPCDMHNVDIREGVGLNRLVRGRSLAGAILSDGSNR
jgi:hypothetical protein